MKGTSLARRIHRLESDLPPLGLRMFVLYDDGAPTHYRHRERWDVERFLLTGDAPPLLHMYLVHVPAEWQPEPEDNGFEPIPANELSESTEKLIRTLQLLGPGGQIQRVAGQPGPVDDSATLQGQATGRWGKGHRAE